MQKLFKNKFHFLTLVISAFLLFSFTQSKVWLDKDLKKTNEKNGLYYRPAPDKKRSGFYIIDYYRNGNKFREGKAKSAKVSEEQFFGIVSYFYKNGKISKKEEYEDGLLDGDYFEYFEKGEVKAMGSYTEGKKDGVWKFFTKSGKIKQKGKYRDGQKVGVWKTYYKNVYYPDNE